MHEEIWHNLDFKEVARILNTDLNQGLSEKEVILRQKKFGKNKLPEEKPLSSLKIFLDQFKSPLIYILVIAGIITLILKEYIDTLVIFGAVFLNTVIGFVQEYKASRALERLKKVVKVEAKVIREGNPKIVNLEDLVLGDVFLLSPGDKVPADGRLVEAYNLKTNEMVLTGEWLPAEKHTNILPKETPMADRDNMVYMGTIVEDGKAKVIVTGTGLATEIGKVAKLLREAREEKTPLQKKLAHFGKIVGIIIGLICFTIFLTGVIVGRPALEIFTMSVALAVAAIPSGLPIAMTVILTIGMERILRRKGLVRKLLAAETLGSTSVICSDKTATLTEGKMKVTEILTPKQIFTHEIEKNKSYFLALRIATLCSEAFIENPQEEKEKWIIRGDPTSRALLLAGLEAGFSKKELEKETPEIEKIPFNPINKFVAGLYKLDEKQLILYLTGAPEKILSLSAYLDLDQKVERLDKEKLQILNSKLERLAEKGLRVVAVAYRKFLSELKYQKLEEICNNLTFVGFIGLKDPLRKEVKQAIKICRQAGMRPILVTGDHKLTAKAIAKEIGLKTEEENIIEGKELDRLSDKEFEKRIKDIEVYARAEPRHKMRIIEVWQKLGEAVAMTGDGVNDAPALKKADIGVAVGSGTEVAKEMADLVLLPDSFNIIVAAVEEGRVIIDNLRKAITYLFSVSVSEVFLISSVLIIGTVLIPGLPLPLIAAQILWINLLEGALPAFALALEPKEKGIMRRKPEGKNIPLLIRESKILILNIAILSSLILVFLFLWLYQRYGEEQLSYIRTMIFACLTLESFFFIFSCRSLKRNLWQINPFSNKYLIGAWFFAVFMLLLAIYLPPLQTLLRTVPLGLKDWLIFFGLGVFGLVLIEVVKWCFIVRKKSETQFR